MGTVTTESIKSKDGIKEFLWFPYQLYKSCPFWIPPIWITEKEVFTKTNPSFANNETQLWVARDRSGKVIGRIAAIHGEVYKGKENESICRFGWLESINDINVVISLFKKVEEWAIERGAKLIKGPLGYSDMDKQGLLVDGFERPASIASQYNPPYYGDFIEKIGYEKDIDWLEFELRLGNQVPDRIVRTANIIKRRYDIEEYFIGSKSELMHYSTEIFKLVNECYKDLYGYVALDPDQMKYYAEMYMGILRRDFISLLKDRDGELVGVGITMPSLSAALKKINGKIWPFGILNILYSLRYNNRADGYLIAIHPKYQNKGLHTIMFNSVFSAQIKSGIKYFETGIELEENTRVQRLWRDFEHQLIRRRRCFKKHL